MRDVLENGAVKKGDDVSEPGISPFRYVDDGSHNLGNQAMVENETTDKWFPGTEMVEDKVAF